MLAAIHNFMQLCHQKPVFRWHFNIVARSLLSHLTISNKITLSHLYVNNHHYYLQSCLKSCLTCQGEHIAPAFASVQHISPNSSMTSHDLILDENLLFWQGMGRLVWRSFLHSSSLAPECGYSGLAIALPLVQLNTFKLLSETLPTASWFVCLLVYKGVCLGIHWLQHLGSDQLHKTVSITS